MLKVLGLIVAAILAVLTVMGMFMTMGQIPDSKAVTGIQLSNGTKQDLVEEGIVAGDESIEYYYSEDLFSFVDYGNLFTDKRVVSYELDPDTNEKVIYSATYDEISDLEFYKSAEMIEDSTIEVYRDGEYSFTLVVSNEEDGDEAFYSKLVQTWKASQSIELQVTDTQELPSDNRTEFSELAY